MTITVSDIDARSEADLRTEVTALKQEMREMTLRMEGLALLARHAFGVAGADEQSAAWPDGEPQQIRELADARDKVRTLPTTKRGS